MDQHQELTELRARIAEIEKKVENLSQWVEERRNVPPFHPNELLTAEALNAALGLKVTG